MTHLLILSKPAFHPEEVRVLMEMISDDYYTIKLSDEEYEEFWKFYKKLKKGTPPTAKEPQKEPEPIAQAPVMTQGPGGTA